MNYDCFFMAARHDGHLVAHTLAQRINDLGDVTIVNVLERPGGFYVLYQERERVSTTGPEFRIQEPLDRDTVLQEADRILSASRKGSQEAAAYR